MHATYVATACIIRSLAAGATLGVILFAFSLLAVGQGRIGTALKIEKVKLEEFGDLNTDEVKGRLDLFAAELSKAQHLRGVIVGYRREDLRPGFFFREIYGYQNYLTNSRGIEPRRLKVMDGGVKAASTSYLTTQLWLVPSGTTDPVMPAVPAEVNAPRQFDSVALGSGCVWENTLVLGEPDDALKFFAAALREKPGAKGFVLVHPSSREPLSKAIRFAASSRESLVSKYHLAPARVFAKVEARRHCSEIELWLAPANLAIPQTLSPGMFFQSQLMTEAEQNEYSVRRVELLGNTYTRDNVIRRRLLQNEGDVFRRSLLEQSLKNLSKLRNFRPVRMQDVAVHLNREEKTIDFLINLTELTRPRQRRTQ